jgi:hypothetical protein
VPTAALLSSRAGRPGNIRRPTGFG